MPCRATQDGWVMVESSDRTWSTGEGNGKPLQYSCLEDPMNVMKRQKDRERVTGRKARGLQMEEVGCKCQTLSLSRGRRKQTSDIFFLLYTNLKGGFS